MSYTIADIQEKLAKRINYQEIVRLLELDLNTIAQEVITDAEEYIEFKVFFDADDFDTTVNIQAIGDGSGFFVTPVMLQLVGGSYSTEKGPQVYQTEFRIEVFGLEKDLDNLRKILEVYSSLNQGAITNDLFANAMTTSITDFPVVSEPFQYKGFTRISMFMSWMLTFIYRGQLANEVEILIDDEMVDTFAFNIKRSRISDTIQRNDETESSTINKSQVLVFNGGMIFDNSDVAKKILRDLKQKGGELNPEYVLTINYPMVLDELGKADSDVYDVTITDGDITINAGGYLTLTFTMTLI